MIVSADDIAPGADELGVAILDRRLGEPGEAASPPPGWNAWR